MKITEYTEYTLRTLIFLGLHRGQPLRDLAAVPTTSRPTCRSGREIRAQATSLAADPRRKARKPGR